MDGAPQGYVLDDRGRPRPEREDIRVDEAEWSALVDGVLRGRVRRSGPARLITSVVIMELRTIAINWVPFQDAGEDLRTAFESLGHRFAIFEDAAPWHWKCEACDQDHDLRALGIGTGISVGIPVCPTRGCAGHGFELLRPAGEDDE